MLKDEIEKQIDFIYGIFWHSGTWKNNQYIIKESYKVFKEQLTTAILELVEKCVPKRRECKCDEDAPYCICGYADYNQALAEIKRRIGGKR